MPFARLEDPEGNPIMLDKDQIAAMRRRRPSDSKPFTEVILKNGLMIRVKEAPDDILARGR
jgi:hypothetical protein